MSERGKRQVEDALAELRRHHEERGAKIISAAERDLREAQTAEVTASRGLAGATAALAAAQQEHTEAVATHGSVEDHVYEDRLNRAVETERLARQGLEQAEHDLASARSWIARRTAHAHDLIEGRAA